MEPVIIDDEPETVRLNWQCVTVPRLDAGDEELTYMIEAQRGPTMEWQPIARNIRDTSYQVTGLGPHEDYHFRIRGESRDFGYTEPSPSLPLYRRPSKASAEVSSLVFVISDPVVKYPGSSDSKKAKDKPTKAYDKHYRPSVPASPKPSPQLPRRTRFDMPRRGSINMERRPSFDAAMAETRLARDMQRRGSIAMERRPSFDAAMADRQPSWDRLPSVSETPRAQRWSSTDRLASLDRQPSVERLSSTERRPSLNRWSSLERLSSLDRQPVSRDKQPSWQRWASLEKLPTLEKPSAPSTPQLRQRRFSISGLPSLSRTASADKSSTFDRQAHIDRGLEADCHTSADRAASLTPQLKRARRFSIHSLDRGYSKDLRSASFDTQRRGSFSSLSGSTTSLSERRGSQDLSASQKHALDPSSPVYKSAAEFNKKATSFAKIAATFAKKAPISSASFAKSVTSSGKSQISAPKSTPAASKSSQSASQSPSSMYYVITEAPVLEYILDHTARYGNG